MRFGRQYRCVRALRASFAVWLLSLAKDPEFVARAPDISAETYKSTSALSSPLQHDFNHPRTSLELC